MTPWRSGRLRSSWLRTFALHCSVTWVNGEVAVEGVEADDYAESRSLLGLIRRADKTMARALEDVPADIRHLPIVNQRDEIDAPYSRNGLAVKLAEDGLVGWAAFAISRVGLYGRLRPTIGRARRRQRMARSASGRWMGPPAMTGPLSIERKRSIAAALLRFAQSGAPPSEGETELTIDPGADALIRRDPFAFLIGVIFDQGIPFERAWLAPLELTKRLGHLDPVRMVAEPESVRVAVQTPPKLHRFVENVPAWVVLAAKKVLEDYAGDAGRIWGDEPTARELQRRLTGFVGVGQKKAAMAVEILERDLGVPIRELHGRRSSSHAHRKMPRRSNGTSTPTSPPTTSRISPPSRSHADRAWQGVRPRPSPSGPSRFGRVRPTGRRP
jgi:uncharacterized HhH-GPD family protein